MTVQSAINLVVPALPGKPLLISDIEHLARSGINRETAERALLRRVDSLAAGQIVGRNGSGDYAGILFPYVWPGEQHVREYRLRRDHPEIENGKTRNKYLSPPGRGNMLYFVPGTRAEWLSDPTLPIVLTEGEKKCLSLHQLGSHAASGDAEIPDWLAIAIGGVWNWRGRTGKTNGPNGERLDEVGPIADLGRIVWKNRTIKIIFDSNVDSNEQIKIARLSLAKYLRSEGAKVLFVDIPADAGVNGIDDLIGAWGEERVLQLITENAYDPQRCPARIAAEDWPEPEPILAELPPVKSLSEEMLPEFLWALVYDIAERMQVPLDFPAAISVLSLAGAVNRRAVIQPKARDRSWVVTPNLWGAIIARPGLLKSPTLRASIGALETIEKVWRLEDAEARKEFELKQEEYEIRRAAWKAQAVGKFKKTPAASLDDRPEGEFAEPKPRRLIANDTTFEALHHMMSNNPAGILVTRDELTGWLAQLDKPGREGERAFCLEAWNGDSPFTIDRIGRGSVHVENCCMSLLGGIQPAKLRPYLVDTLSDGPGNDGLIQRFQVLVWPDMSRDWEYVDRLPNARLISTAESVLKKLTGMDAENPKRFRFSDEAQELFVHWLRELERKVRGDELHEALIAHLSKYRSLMPSLALLFELADQEANGRCDPSEQQVSLKHAQQAAAWCEYLESHAGRVYSCVVTPQVRAANELSQKIKARKVGDANGWFTGRDVYLKRWSGLHTPEIVAQGADILCDAGWLRAFSKDSTDPLGRGRSSHGYFVNPRVWR